MRIFLVERNLREWAEDEWRPWGLWHTTHIDAKLERKDHQREHPDWRFRVRPYRRIEQSTEA